MAHPLDVSSEDLGIGRKVRDLRQKRRYTLQDVSAKTGLPKSLLSQVEGGDLMPPVATLLKIGRALGVDVSYFLQEQKEAERKVAVTRAGERQVHSRRGHQDPTQIGYTYESLELHKRHKHMQPFLVTVAEMPKGEMTFYTHEGEECVFVLEGQLEFRTPDEATALSAGDCLYFESSVAHAFRSTGGGAARALIVVYSGEEVGE